MQQSIRVGVIGAGHWGPNLIRCFSQSKLSTVTGICDSDPARLSLLTKTYPNIQLGSDWRGLCESSTVDALVIATPTASHAEIVQYALENRKHVFVEKPLCTSSVEATQLSALANDRGLKLFVGHVFLFNAGIRYLKTLIDTQELGEIQYLSATRTNLGPIRGDVNVLWDLGSHDVAILLYLLNGTPRSVTAFGSSHINPPIEDVVFAGLRFEKNTLATLHCSWLDPKKVRQLLVVGSKKMAVFDDMSPEQPIRIYDKSVDKIRSPLTLNDDIVSFRKSIIEGPSFSPKIEYLSPLQEECNAFLEWLCWNKSHPNIPQLAVDVVRTVEELSRHLRSNAERKNNERL